MPMESLKNLVESPKKELRGAVKGKKSGRYVLDLYVMGASALSSTAVINLKKICEEHLKGRYDLKVFDLCHQPYLAAEAQLIAAPTLIKRHPLPVRRIIGDMSDKEKVLLGLAITQAGG